MRFKTDVLIIGGGGAACRAAIEAADSGAQILLISKKTPVKAGATSFPVAEMAGYNAGDPSVQGEVEKHYNDIVAAGCGMADPALAAVLAANAPETIRRLEEWGVRFDRDDDGYYIFKSCFSNYPRTHVIRGHGEPIIRAMVAQMSKRSNIKIIDNITISGLIVNDGCCVGAYGWKNDDLEEVIIEAGAVIMATGGVSQAFEKNLNPTDVTGDGYTLGYEAGAELINMEFMQIGIGFCHPVINIFNAYIWEGLPALRNANGEDFLGRNLPSGLTAEDVMHAHRKHFPFSTSDCSGQLEIAIHREIHEGRGTEHHGVIVDLRNMTDKYVNSRPDDCGLHHMWPIAREYMKKRGVDLLSEEVEICCFAHAINGGLLIDTKGATSLPGLYAAGETAGGPHGSDRLGGNMLVTCQVFGAIAGKSAAIWSFTHKRNQKPEMELQAEIQLRKELLCRDFDTATYLAKLRRCTQDNLLVVRTEKGLNEVLETVAEIEKELMTAPVSNKIHLENFALHSMLTSVKLMAQAAAARKESRGSHHRADYPYTDPKFDKPQVIQK